MRKKHIISYPDLPGISGHAVRIYAKSKVIVKKVIEQQ